MAHPVRLVVSDDLRRSRLTVLVRLPLALPQLVWGLVWALVVFGLLATGTLLLGWLVTLFSGRLWPELHELHARLLRWATHVSGYLFLLSNPYPRFDGRPGYPVDLEIAPPERQPRLVTGFRLFLALPALVFASALAGVLHAVAFAGWFVCLALGRMPRGMRDLGAYCLWYQLETYAYVLLLTPRYPTLAFEPVGRPAPADDATA